MNQVLVSTGALIGRPNGRDYRLLKEYVPRLSCDGIEFMMYSTWYEVVDTLISDLKSYHMNVPVMHCQKTIGESLAGMETTWDGQQFCDRVFSEEEDRDVFQVGCNNFVTNLRVAGEIGAKSMVLHLWNGTVSDKNIEKNIERFGIFNELAKKAGIRLMVENVICNQKDPMTHMKRLRECYPEVLFVYDTKMAAFHNQTENIFLPEWEWMLSEGHVQHFHMNDYGGGYMDWGNLRVLPIGAGRVDFDSFMEKLSKYNYKGDYTLEATGFNKEGVVDFDMLNQNVASMKKLLLGN